MTVDQVGVYDRAFSQSETQALNSIPYVRAAGLATKLPVKQWALAASSGKPVKGYDAYYECKV